MTYRIKRYITYTIITCVVILLPFFQINNHQIFLLSFDRKELHLLGSVFNMQELYVMPFLLICLFVGIFFITTLLGRFWCGWACPQTIFRVIFRDLIEGKIFGLNKISNKQIPQNLSSISNQFKKLLSLTILMLICLSASAVFLFYFVPPSDFFNIFIHPQKHLILLGFWFIIGIFLTFDIAILKENFCIYVCPYSRVQSVLFDDHTQTVIYDSLRGGIIDDRSKKPLVSSESKNAQTECINCQKCVRVCPTHIDIRKGMQLECINCLECVDACTSVMEKLGKKTLVNWTSQNALAQHQKVQYWRGKTIGYVIILTLAVFLAIFMGEKKDNILLNITRPTSLYTIHTDHTITNEYILLVENMTPTQSHFKITIDHPDFKIIRPTRDFTLHSEHKKRIVLVLKYIGKAKNLTKDQSIPIKITISSLKDPSLFVQRESIFIYPKENK